MMDDQLPNYENLLYLNPGNSFLVLSAKEGLSDLEKEQEMTLLNLETGYLPNSFSSKSSKYPHRYM